MMSNHPVTDEIVNDMKLATQHHDGETAARILQEVGSCGWPALVTKMNNPDRSNVGINVTRNATGFDVGTFFEFGPNGMAVPLATVMDLQCNR